ncbi:hypothetical protein GCM10025867_00550 [Frondihabitans sucicola]|uniref:Peptidase M24 domain-containing protein n=1 Tax=Frondihabitans sucicola TaxID=1268041 RepID=A0ABN6XSH8_9MICO|nr:hypothetical protein GCM10025867_00550 [Frondihabitans sucicola]
MAPLRSTFGDEILRENEVAGELQAARAALVPAEVDRYRRLCREVAALMSTVLAGVRPDDTERQVAARLAGGLVALGADPLVVLAAGRDRLSYRHPLPTTGPIGAVAMVVVCARRQGLIANVTRWIRFTPATAEEEDVQRRLFEVEHAFFAATRPGAVLSDVFAAGTAAYAEQGFAADEWTRHHQGGPTGYNGRDPRAGASADGLVVSHQAFAWNPNVPGAKVEDTVLVGNGDPEVLSVAADWPTLTVSGLARPLVREQ